jgi:nitrogen PTS system EIIA component
MHLTEFLDFEAIKPALSAGNKRALLQQLANLAGSRLEIAPSKILDTVREREKLGPTGFGQGVAIPHGKVEGLAQIYCLFVRLSDPVRYKAIDGVPVDLVFLLLSPPMPERNISKRSQRSAGSCVMRLRSKRCVARAAAMRWPRC